MKTDFATWSRENLEKIARELADENAQLRDDNKVLLAAWRAEVAKRNAQPNAATA